MVYDDGRIIPMGWALKIEADIERLNKSKTLGEPPPTSATAPGSAPGHISSTDITSFDITKEPLRYDGMGVLICGQTYFEGVEPWLLVDGKSGIRITGNTAGLQKGFYCLIGKYNADTNTINVTQFDERQAEYLTIETGKRLDIDLIRVPVIGLIATTPKEIANMLTIRPTIYSRRSCKTDSGVPRQDSQGNPKKRGVESSLQRIIRDIQSLEQTREALAKIHLENICNATFKEKVRVIEILDAKVYPSDNMDHIGVTCAVNLAGLEDEGKLFSCYNTNIASPKL